MRLLILVSCFHRTVVNLLGFKSPYKVRILIIELLTTSHLKKSKRMLEEVI